ncbi:MAG: peptidase M64 [Bacteroidales bacterium]|nr:peptidase M64 [Bacteroidales bacterium]
MNRFTTIVLSTVLILLGLDVKSQVEYDKFFTDNQLRIDYYLYGNADTVSYALDKLVKEEQWGGPRTQLIDESGNGMYLVEVSLPDSDVILYSHGYCLLFGEWQTSEEATRINKGFHESVIIPYPKETVEVTFYAKTDLLELVEQMKILVNPNDYFIKPAPKLPYPIYNVYGDYPIDKAVDIVLLPDGYTEQEMGKFINDCQFFVKSLFGYEPYNRYQDRFNIRAVLVPSQDSDITMPGDRLYRNTALSCSFWTFDSERYCMTYDNETMKTLAGQVPYDQIYILANTKKYGGGGIFNSYCVSTTGNSYSSDVIIHEFSHGFAGLADEYAYDGTDNYNTEVEPWEPNITTLVNFEAKWKDMVSKKTPVPTPVEKKYNNTVGVYEGAGYQKEDIYRPMIDCLMNTFNGDKFCPVCERAIERMIKYYTE